MTDQVFEDLYQRNVEESIRQGTAKPFVEEAMLQVSNWGFSLPEFRMQKKCKANGVLSWLMSMYSESECELTGFQKPIHIWQVCWQSLFKLSIFMINFFRVVSSFHFTCGHIEYGRPSRTTFSDRLH